MKIESQDIYAEVQRRFLGALARDTVPWQQPWITTANAPRNLQSGKAYRGINALLLGLSDFSDPRWTTFNAARKMGAFVQAGEKSTLITLWKRIQVKDADAPNGKKTIAMLRYFRLFNVEQVEWPDGVLPELPRPEDVEGWDPHEAADATLAAYLDSPGAPRLRHNGANAHYTPSTHEIVIPAELSFRTAEGFYGTAFHECAHSTAPILKRELSTQFGSDPYAREELVAEMAAAFVCASIGINGGFDNSVSYIKGWSRRIADDPKLVIKAAGLAQRAADRILGIDFPEPEIEAATPARAAA